MRMIKKTVAMAVVAIAFMSSNNSFAQTGKSFEGKITYAIDLQGLPPEAASMMAGSEMIVAIKSPKSRAEMKMGAVSKTTTISDYKAKTAVTLMDMMGQKYMIKSNLDDPKNTDKPPVPTIKYLTDTKEIAGYKCKKAQITITSKDGKSNTIDIYYTDELPYYSPQDMYKGLKGFPMEYEMRQGQMVMKMTAKSVSKETVPDSEFVVPEGYKETTKEDIQKNMMKGAGQ